MGTASIGVISTICFAFAPQIISLFRNEAEVIEIGSEALRIQCVFLLFFPACMVVNMLFQSIGKSIPALVLSCLQSGLIFIPLCVVLPRFWGVKGIEAAQPLAYFVTMLISVPCMVVFLRRLPKDE